MSISDLTLAPLLFSSRMDKDKSYQWIMIVFRTCQQSLKGDIVGSSSDPLASDSSISQDKSDGRRNTNPLNLAQSDIRFGTRNDRVQDRIDYHWVNILQFWCLVFFLQYIFRLF